MSERGKLLSSKPNPGSDETDEAVEAPLRMVVVPRRWKRPDEPGRRRQVGHGWTLHLEDCGYAKRATATARPAPQHPYPHTEPCIYCKPTGDTGKRITRSPRGQGSQSQATKAARPQPEQRHTYTYTNVTDDQGEIDEVEAACQVCDVVARGPSRGAAKTAAYRMHEARRPRRGAA